MQQHYLHVYIILITLAYSALRITQSPTISPSPRTESSNDSINRNTYLLFWHVFTHQAVNTNVLLRWVPIPMPYWAIKKELEANFGIVLKITDKKHSDGLRSRIRIVTMKKSCLLSNPIPSYIQVSGCEIYVTYQRQVTTCKYCDHAGYGQSECHKRETDFPALTRSKPRESSTALPETNVHPEPVFLSKKRKI